jgi:signal transduction histidine kinase
VPTNRLRIGLRTQLVWPLALLLLVTVALTFWSAWQALAQAKASAEAELATHINTLTRPPSFPLTDAVLSKMKGLTGCEFLLVRAGGTSTGTTANADVGELSPGVELNGYRYSVVDIPETHPNFGSILWVGYPTARSRERQMEAIRGPVVLGIAVVLAILLLLWSGTKLVNRIHRVKAQAEALVHDGAIELVTEKNDELGDLQKALSETALRLRAYQKQQQDTERLRLLGQFSGGLAHQLRNAATAAKLSVQLSLQETPPEEEGLHVALRQLQRMESMLQQFLQVGKPAIDSSMSLVNLEDVIYQVAESYGSQAKHLDISLIVDCHDNDRLLGDDIGLGHLIGNLLDNALDAAGPGGNVVLRCVLNVLEVCDSGKGPPPEIQAKLFEPFVTTKPQGIGLGLAVAQQVAQAHGTTIEWYFGSGGTTFSVRFSPSTSASDPLRPRS